MVAKTSVEEDEIFGTPEFGTKFRREISIFEGPEHIQHSAVSATCYRTCRAVKISYDLTELWP